MAPLTLARPSFRTLLLAVVAVAVVYPSTPHLFLLQGQQQALVPAIRADQHGQVLL